MWKGTNTVRFHTKHVLVAQSTYSVKKILPCNTTYSRQSKPETKKGVNLYCSILFLHFFLVKIMKLDFNCRFAFTKQYSACFIILLYFVHQYFGLSHNFVILMLHLSVSAGKLVDYCVHERITVNWSARGALVWTHGRKILHQLDPSQPAYSHLSDILSAITTRARSRYGLHVKLV